MVFAAVVVSLVVSLVWQAAPAFRHSGFNFIFSGTWSPDTEKFGAGVFIVDTLITTGVGLTNLAYNRPRWVQLIQLGRVPTMAAAA